MTTTRLSRHECAITIRGGPTAVIDVGHPRIVSDPALDECGRAAGSAHVPAKCNALRLRLAHVASLPVGVDGQ
ncbi:hypothetical protein ACFY0A_28205 [Streptomyces sp. NPDC001698]|uniref:hypothetical protein n=1 Tax=unclassified Streptomyces TaxID=2593676 RepID=UPI0036AD5112